MSFNKFKKLHHQDQALVLGNVWDAQSAKLAEQAGFQALGSSSHAIANSLGYEDGEQIPVEELIFVVEKIVKAVKIPVSVDFESGYSNDPEKVARYVKKLADVGVVGINLEDGKVVKGVRKLQKAEVSIAKIKAIKALSPNVYINARVDAYTTKQKDALAETIKRAKLYEKAGADGLFVPLLESKKDIQAIVKATKLPLNVFLTEKLPKIDVLNTIGVKRLSQGAKIYAYLVAQNAAIFAKYIKNPKLPK